MGGWMGAGGCGNGDMLCTTNNKNSNKSSQNNNSNQEQLIEGSAVYQLNMLAAKRNGMVENGMKW